MRAPQPDQIYARAREEGKRRLSRPPLELAATALVGGFDVAFGVAAYGLAAAATADRLGHDVGHLAGSLAFGLGFVFVAVGRSELFTENFLVPIASLDRSRQAYAKLAELWVGTLVLNILGGSLIAVILTTGDVLPDGVGAELVRLTERLAELAPGPAFLSALIAGALMTLMTWFIEGAADSAGVRIAMSWAVGFLIVLGGFNHAVVSQIELVYGMRYGGDVSLSEFFLNFGLAVGGNIVGGLGLVTFARFVQARKAA